MPATEPPANGSTAGGTAARLGRAIGTGYEVGEMIGRGGFGEVYSALDRSLKRTVAIKVLRADIADSGTAIDRFRREAEALARLRHPHIMPVYGIGEGEGLTYFVMPRIEGESLADLMARGEQLTLPDACRVIAETADALAAAHRAGVVHRDIKPDNILLEGVERHALLMDFGIAKSGGAAEGRLTATGMIIGTPLYMSPEQATGDHIGPASDIYSLGVVAYELLAGRPLFGAQTSPQQAVAAHLTLAPQDLRGVNTAVPSAIASAVMRCLRKEPAARWGTVEEFVRVMNQARADLPRNPDVAIPDAPPPLRARQRLLIASLGVAGAATAFAVFTTATPTLDAPRTTRDAALADAESLLTALALPRYRERAWRYQEGGPPAAFLQKRGETPPPSPASLSRVPLGEWRFAFYTTGTPGYVRVTMGGPQWASGFERVIDTTAVRLADRDTGAAIPVAATLRALGWDPDSLRPVDSTRTVTNGRIQHTWSWTPLGTSGLVVSGDTATRRVTMTFTDGQLTRYRTTASLPAAAAARGEKRRIITNVVMSSLLVLVLAGMAADLIIAHRRRALRLERALRIAAINTVLLAAPFAILAGSGSGAFAFDFNPERAQIAGTLFNLFLIVVVLCPFVFLATAALTAACETLALRSAPSLLAGYQALASRPRLRRLAAPLPVGTALGLALAGAAAVAAVAASQVTGTPLLADQSWTNPRLESAGQLCLVVALALPAIAMTAVLMVHLRAVGSLARAVPGALLVGVAVAAALLAAQAPATSLATAGVVALGLSLIVARRGVVEAMVAFISACFALNAFEAWRAPHSDPWPAMLALALLAGCALAAGLVRAAPAPGDGAVGGTHHACPAQPRTPS